MYKVGGWKAKPGSWSKGFRSSPFIGTGKIIINGFEVSKMNNKKIKVISDWNERVKVLYWRSNLLSNFEIKKPKKTKTNTQSYIEPSWFPHTPVILYKRGLAECEFWYTFNKEKSETT